MTSNMSDVHEYYDYADLYSNEPARATVPPEEIILPCFPTASDKLYHTCISALSLVVLLILAAFTKRKRLCPGFLKGVPGLLSPVNFLDHTQHKGLVGAVFGGLFCRLVVVVLAKNPLPFTEDPAPENKEYWKILALFYYPALYYPLLACGTLHSRVGYVLGSLLSWTHFSVLVWQKVDCPQTPEIYKFYSLLSSLPQIVCLAFLSFQYPLLLFKNSGTAGQTNTSEDLHSSYYKEYVQKILRKKVTKSSSSTFKPTIPSRISAALQSYIYTPEDGFRFPLKLVISAVVSIISVYQVMLLLVLLVIPTLQKVRGGVNEDIAFLLAGFNIILSENRAEVVEIVKNYLWTVEVCYISTVTLSGLVTLVMLMRSMVLHRSNLKGLYRGDIYSVYNRQRSIRPSRPAIVCWMGFTSYQAALVCIALLIQTLVFFICILWFVFLILIPILFGQNLILFRILKVMWPFWLMLCLVVIVQHVMAKFAFLKKDAGTRDLDNRQGLFLLTYLLFPVNVLVGVLLGVWRIVITGLFNIIHLGRLDISLLNRGVESFDPGYRCYVHYLKIEVSQSHPVMKAFCSVLLQPPASEGTAGQKMTSVEEGIQLVQQDKKQKMISNSRRIRGRWWLVFTLVNNPSLVTSRKHFQAQSSEAFLNGTLNRTTKESGSEPEKTDTKSNDV
ncbi:receptor for retinol uptake stra6-like isoform X1 [Acipenser ruthenus]|uniref:receptor for retinol uptake stra6-like isoform X1 n=1 Tax=Acipenser ruthenus TaxID=7906 RepID=UPI00145C0CCB|nr:receptor for retinol uptake stra6-like isoform X1 [Acipenser ruthenus]XP_058854530.1 receptor for retinol uptake stra6-like isoform X1 [Acipenser ruthenus]